MRKLNQLYGKDVIHQTTGNRISSVADVVLDNDVRRIVALVVGAGDGTSSKRIVRWEGVVGVGDVIVINSALPLAAVDEDFEVSELLAHANRITGTTIVSDGGERLGAVGDMFIDDQGEITGYEVSQGLFRDLRGRKFLPVDDVRAVGKDAVIAAGSALPTVKETEQGREAPEQPAEPAVADDSNSIGSPPNV